MGYKGQRKIMKRVNAPKQWYLGKLKGVYSTKPSAGPHKTRECIPLNVLLMQRLKYAMSRQESIKIVKDKEVLIKVDGKIRRDPRFPLGQMDVVTIEKTNEHFRILYDIKGRFQPHRIDAKEAGFKLCKVTQKKIGKSKVPHIVTNDGRTIRFPHPDIQINDSVKYDFKTRSISGVIKFEAGATAMLIGGNNVGRIGKITSIEKHPGSFEIVHVRDSKGNSFSTRQSNILVIGDNKTSAVSIPKGEGVRLTLIQERDQRLGDESSDDNEEEDN
jgi:small subunit ribosomal protein S4e